MINKVISVYQLSETDFINLYIYLKKKTFQVTINLSEVYSISDERAEIKGKFHL